MRIPSDCAAIVDGDDGHLENVAIQISYDPRFRRRYVDDAYASLNWAKVRTVMMLTCGVVTPWLGSVFQTLRNRLD